MLASVRFSRNEPLVIFLHNCPNCETPTNDPVLTYSSQAKFVFIEFSPEIMDLINLSENMHVGSSVYKLKGMVRCYNGHFTCAVLTQGKWTYIDDLCAGVKEFCTLASLKKNFAKGWFFVIYESMSMFNIEADPMAYSSSMNSNNMTEEVQLGDCEIKPLISKRGHFMNTILSVPNMYSCAVDTFLEVSSHLFLPYLSTLTVRNEFTELLLNTCARYIESQGNDRLLRELREPIWIYLQQHCPSFLARDSNACFSQIFEERTFGDLSSEEMNIFSSQRIFESFCKTCHDNVAFKSSLLVNYVTRSALQKCQLHHNSWPHFISTTQTEPGKLNCPNCETPTNDPVLTYSSQAKFVFIEFSPEIMDLINLCEGMHVGSSEYKLKGMVRCYNGHFTCAVLTQGKWTYIDDLCAGVKQFCTLAALKRQFSKGWFFAIYEDSDIVSKHQSCGIVNQQMKSNIDFTEIPINLKLKFT